MPFAVKSCQISVKTIWQSKNIWYITSYKRKTLCQISLKKRVKKNFPLSVVRWLLSVDENIKSIISIFQVSPKLGFIPIFCYTFAYGVLRKPLCIPMVFFELPFGRPKEYDKETKRQRVENWKLILWQTKRKLK
jgi:hypothetical protein